MDMPQWIIASDLPKRDKARKHRRYMILRVLALRGPFSMYELEKQLKKELGKINYTAVLRDVPFLEKARLVSIKTGARNAKICEVTNRGVIGAWLQHYLSSEDFLQTLSKRSRVISILTQLPKLRKTTINRVLATLPSIYRLWALGGLTERLEDQQIGGKPGSIEAKEDKRYDEAWEEHYENLTFYLAFDLLSDLTDSVAEEELITLKKEELELLRDRASEALKEWGLLTKTSQHHYKKTQRLIKVLDRLAETVRCACIETLGR